MNPFLYICGVAIGVVLGMVLQQFLERPIINRYQELLKEYQMTIRLFEATIRKAKLAKMITEN